MTTKNETLAKLSDLQKPKKPRRTAQEVARAALVKERDRIAIAWKRATAKVNVRFQDKFDDAERALLAFEKAVSTREEPTDDE